MHTDEYEISLAREIDHCKRVVKKIKAGLTARSARYGMEYPLAAVAASHISERDLDAWREDFEALPEWERRLGEYCEALAAMRISASRF